MSITLIWNSLSVSYFIEPSFRTFSKVIVKRNVYEWEVSIGFTCTQFINQGSVGCQYHFRVSGGQIPRVFLVNIQRTHRRVWLSNHEIKHPLTPSIYKFKVPPHRIQAPCYCNTRSSEFQTTHRQHLFFLRVPHILWRLFVGWGPWFKTTGELLKWQLLILRTENESGFPLYVQFGVG